MNILNGINLAVENGDIVTVIGPNGAGKSTLMKVLCGLIRPRAGKIAFDGDDITGHSAHSVVRSGIGYVPQLSNVFHDPDRRGEPRSRVHRNPRAQGTRRPGISV